MYRIDCEKMLMLLVAQQSKSGLKQEYKNNTCIFSLHDDLGAGYQIKKDIV